jgi:hypothetical protein
MISGAGLFLAAVVVAGLLYFIGRYIARQKLLRGRQPLEVAEIVSDLPASVGRNEASEVLQVIGKSFRLRPEILRLDDSMSTLMAIDSWTLGHGQEELERWLKARGVDSLQRKPSTIRELIVSVLPFDAHHRVVVR